MIHNNSITAYAESKKTFGERARLIYDWLKDNGPATDKAIAKALGFAHKSSVQPRISELTLAGMVREVGQAIDSETGKRVRIVGL
jgi:hypothetical protein